MLKNADKDLLINLLATTAWVRDYRQTRIERAWIVVDDSCGACWIRLFETEGAYPVDLGAMMCKPLGIDEVEWTKTLNDLYPCYIEMAQKAVNKAVKAEEESEAEAEAERARAKAWWERNRADYEMMYGPVGDGDWD